MINSLLSITFHCSSGGIRPSILIKIILGRKKFQAGVPEKAAGVFWKKCNNRFFDLVKKETGYHYRFPFQSIKYFLF